MPKRTNEFQTLVKRLYEQMAGSGEKVTESAMVKERGLQTEREIDILLQRRIFGTNMRIAVECRGRADKDDIEWIDALIGKYRDLDIEKIIAVSKSGFTKAAKEKGALNRIDTLTMEEGLDTDWPSQFARLGMTRLVRHDTPRSVQLVTDPPLPFPLSLDTPLLKEAGEKIGTIEQAARAVYERRKNDINKEIEDQFLKLFKTLEDLNKYNIFLELSQNPVNSTFIEREGERYRLISLTLKMIASFSYEPTTVDHYVLGDAQVTLGTIKSEESKKDFSIVTIQVANKPNEARIHIEPIKRPSKTKKHSTKRGKSK
jgi:hypothetical protein